MCICCDVSGVKQQLMSKIQFNTQTCRFPAEAEISVVWFIGTEKQLLDFEVSGGAAPRCLVLMLSKCTSVLAVEQFKDLDTKKNSQSHFSAAKINLSLSPRCTIIRHNGLYEVNELQKKNKKLL